MSTSSASDVPASSSTSSKQVRHGDAATARRRRSAPARRRTASLPPVDVVALEHDNVTPGGGEADRHGEPANAGADHGDVGPFSHAMS